MALIHLMQTMKQAAHSNDTLLQITGTRFEVV